MRGIIISFIKVLCESLVMGVIVRLLYDILIKNISANLALIAVIIIGAAIYFVMIYFMKIDEVDSMIEAMKKKLGKVHYT